MSENKPSWNEIFTGKQGDVEVQILVPVWSSRVGVFFQENKRPIKPRRGLMAEGMTISGVMRQLELSI